MQLGGHFSSLSKLFKDFMKKLQIMIWSAEATLQFYGVLTPPAIWSAEAKLQYYGVMKPRFSEQSPASANKVTHQQAKPRISNLPNTLSVHHRFTKCHHPGENPVDLKKYTFMIQSLNDINLN
jgi:hypothetical protein